MSTDLVRKAARRALVAILGFAPIFAVTAQSSAPATDSGARIRIGTRIRVGIRDTSPANVIGRFVSIRDDTLYFRAEGEAVTRHVPLDHVTRVEVGRVHGNAGRGFLVGALIGGLTGTVVGSASGSDQGAADYGLSAGDKAVALGVVLGLLGGGIGAIVGSGTQSDDWRPVTPPYTMILAPQRGGTRVGLRLSF